MKERFCRFVVGVTLTLQLFVFMTSAAKSEEQTSDIVNKQLQLLENDFNKGSSSVFLQMLDLDAILDTALTGLDIKPEFKSGFRQAINNQKAAIGQKFIAQITPGGSAKIIRSRTDRGTSRGLIRMDLVAGGYGFMDLYLSVSGNKVVITDWYDYGFGQRYSDSLRQIVVMAAPNPSLIGRMFDVVTSQDKVIDDILAIMKLAKEKNYNKIQMEYTKLAARHKKIRIFMIMMVQVAGASENDEFYKKVLDDLATFHGNDPKLTFLLLDHFYYAGKYEKCLDMLDKFIKEIGIKDDALLSLKANILIEGGNYDKGISLAKQIITKSPDFDFAYWVVLNGFVQAKNYKSAAMTGRELETRFGYVLDKETLGAEPQYKNFINSKEFARWMANKVKK